MLPIAAEDPIDQLPERVQESYRDCDFFHLDNNSTLEDSLQALHLRYLPKHFGDFEWCAVIAEIVDVREPDPSVFNQNPDSGSACSDEYLFNHVLTVIDLKVAEVLWGDCEVATVETHTLARNILRPNKWGGVNAQVLAPGMKIVAQLVKGNPLTCGKVGLDHSAYFSFGVPGTPNFREDLESEVIELFKKSQ